MNNSHSLADADFDLLPPPPAYTEQEEFDQKVSRALELSTETQANVTVPFSCEDDEWQDYDPVAFEAAFQAAAEAHGYNEQHLASSSDAYVHASASQSQSQVQGSSSSPSQLQTPPLRIHKKGNSTEAAGGKSKKDEPKWMALANSQPGTSSSSSWTVHNQGYNDFDGDDLAPPPFSAIAPEPEGGEFDPYSMIPADHPQIEFQHPQQPQLPNPSTPQPYYRPSSSVGVPAPCPAAPTPIHVPIQNFDQFNSPQRQSLPASLPSAPLQPQVYQTHRPISEIPTTPSTFAASYDHRRGYSPKPAPSPGASLMQFNPSIAYGKSARRQPFAMPREEQPAPQAFSASAFYNASVSAHMQLPQVQQPTARAPQGSNGYMNGNDCGISPYGTQSPMNRNSYGLTPEHTIGPGPPMMSGWSPTNRSKSALSIESSYSDNSQVAGRMNMSPYTQSPMNNHWQC